jgi:hypothetical protein
MGGHATTLENIYDEQANCMNPTVVEWRMSMMMMMMMNRGCRMRAHLLNGELACTTENCLML